jgi:hypothetical protein
VRDVCKRRGPRSLGRIGEEVHVQHRQRINTAEACSLALRQKVFAGRAPRNQQVAGSVPAGDYILLSSDEGRYCFDQPFILPSNILLTDAL